MFCEFKKMEVDDILNSLGFEFDGFVDPHELIYNHVRAPISALVYVDDEPFYCALEYSLENSTFSKMKTSVDLNKNEVIKAMLGFKEALVKLGVNH